MKKKILTWILATMALASCNTNSTSEADTDPTVVAETETTVDDGHTSQNSLDYVGAYSGVLPCADCEGIRTEITLNQNETYTKRITYLGKADNEFFEEKGNYTWNTAGRQITLEGQGIPNQYLVGENTLTQLDTEGRKIEGNLAALYMLKK